MKNFNLQMDQNNFYEHTYTISKFSNSFSFFNSEFKDLNYDLEGNILLTVHKEKSENSIHKVLNSIKEYFGNNDHSVGVSMASEGYMYFSSEYSNLSKDANHNIIVPVDEYPKVKVKKN